MSKSIRKILSVLLVGMLSFGVVGCSNTDGGNENNNGGEAKEKSKVTTLVTIRSDKSFFESAANGTDRIGAELGDHYKTQVVEITADLNKYKDSLYEAADSDADIIISGSYNMQEHFEEVAPQYPEKKFIFFDGSVNYDEYDLGNVISLGYETNQASFLAGMAAAKLTTSGHERTNEDKIIGFVGAVENNPVITDFLVGFIEGAKFVDPEVKIIDSYIGNYTDTAKAKELALVQFNTNKADVIFSVAGGANAGVIEAAHDTNRVVIGVDSDQSALYEGRPEQKAIMTSVLKRIDNSLFKVLEDNINGTAPYGQALTLGLSDESVGIVRNDIFNSYIDAEFQKEIDKAEEAIKNGEIKVSSAFQLGIKEVQAIIDAAK